MVINLNILPKHYSTKLQNQGRKHCGMETLGCSLSLPDDDNGGDENIQSNEA